MTLQQCTTAVLNSMTSGSNGLNLPRRDDRRNPSHALGLLLGGGRQVQVEGLGKNVASGGAPLRSKLINYVFLNLNLDSTC